MSNNIWTKRISIIFVLVLVIFLFLLNRGKLYVTETEILVLPKTEIAANNQKIILKNFETVIGSLTFYDGLKDKLETDEVEGLANYQRKDFWKTKVRTEQVNDSGVISIKTFDKTSEASFESNQLVVKQLVLTIGQYYNIKTDLELRIIEKPITKSVNSQNMISVFGISLVSGMIAYLLIFQLIPWLFLNKSYVPKRKQAKTGEMKENFVEKDETFRYTLPVFTEESYEFAKKKIGLPIEDVQVEEQKTETKDISDVIFDTPVSTQKKAASPDNLPVSEEVPAFLFSNEAIRKNEPETEEEMKAEEKDVKREATPEEVKAKLNRLLRGE